MEDKSEEEICLINVLRFYRKRIMQFYNVTAPFVPQFQCVLDENNSVTSLNVYHQDEKTKVNIHIMTVFPEFIHLIAPNVTHQMIMQYRTERDKYIAMEIKKLAQAELSRNDSANNQPEQPSQQHENMQQNTEEDAIINENNVTIDALRASQN